MWQSFMIGLNSELAVVNLKSKSKVQLLLGDNTHKNLKGIWSFENSNSSPDFISNTVTADLEFLSQMIKGLGFSNMFLWGLPNLSFKSFYVRYSSSAFSYRWWSFCATDSVLF